MTDLSLRKSCFSMTLRPQAYASYSVGTVSAVMMALLSLQVILLLASGSLGAVANVSCALSASLLSEFIFWFPSRSMGRIHSWRISAINGLLVGLLLPASYPCFPIFMVTLGVFLVGKFFFGNYFLAWANLSALAVAMLYMLNSSFFPELMVSSGDLQSKNAALLLIQRGAVPTAPFDSAVTGFLNRTVFKFFGVSVPEGYVSLFWDSGSTIPAFRFNFLTIVSSIVLLSLDMVDGLIPAVFLFVYAALIRFAEPVAVGGIPMQGDVLLALLTGGTLFSTLYLLQWYGTAPVTAPGRLAYGVLAGAAAFFIVGFGTSPAGFVFLVLVMNMASAVMQILEEKRFRVKTARVLLPRLRALGEE